jgi:hypothetical protein
LSLSPAERRQVADAIAELCKHKFVATVADLQQALRARNGGGGGGGGPAYAEELRALLREAEAASNSGKPLPGFGRIAFDAVDDEFCFLSAE